MIRGRTVSNDEAEVVGREVRSEFKAAVAEVRQAAARLDELSIQRAQFGSFGAREVRSSYQFASKSGLSSK